MKRPMSEDTRPTNTVDMSLAGVPTPMTEAELTELYTLTQSAGYPLLLRLLETVKTWDILRSIGNPTGANAETYHNANGSYCLAREMTDDLADNVKTALDEAKSKRLERESTTRNGRV